MKKTIYVKPETECIVLIVNGKILESVIGGAGSEDPPEEGDANKGFWDDDSDTFWSD